mmetsp:Transcript_28713/g.69121  ORF Transcript_28713/g.69121 Transcript_28713/m.69121 type:complete len:323 (-) Transcript_28713:452-1420(-)
MGTPGSRSLEMDLNVNTSPFARLTLEYVSSWLSTTRAPEVSNSKNWTEITSRLPSAICRASFSGTASPRGSSRLILLTFSISASSFLSRRGPPMPPPLDADASLRRRRNPPADETPRKQNVRPMPGLPSRSSVAQSWPRSSLKSYTVGEHEHCPFSSSGNGTGAGSVGSVGGTPLPGGQHRPWASCTVVHASSSGARPAANPAAWEHVAFSSVGRTRSGSTRPAGQNEHTSGMTAGPSPPSTRGGQHSSSARDASAHTGSVAGILDRPACVTAHVTLVPVSGSVSSRSGFVTPSTQKEHMAAGMGMDMDIMVDMDWSCRRCS